MTENSQLQAPALDRDTQLEAARQDLRFANQNKITYAALADRINHVLGTRWDKGHARRFILNADSARGTIFGNSLPPDHVSLLRQLAAHIRREVETGLSKTLTPPIEKQFTQASRDVTLTLKPDQAALLEASPKLRAIMSKALNMTVTHVIEAYKAGLEERPDPASPSKPAP